MFGRSENPDRFGFLSGLDSSKRIFEAPFPNGRLHRNSSAPSCILWEQDLLRSCDSTCCTCGTRTSFSGSFCCGINSLKISFDFVSLGVTAPYRGPPVHARQHMGSAWSMLSTDDRWSLRLWQVVTTHNDDRTFMEVKTHLDSLIFVTPFVRLLSVRCLSILRNRWRDFTAQLKSWRMIVSDWSVIWSYWFNW